VRAIIQPGGSQRDEEVIEACNAADVAMVFTAAATSVTDRAAAASLI
jgi:AICAR transformylase/IMP cyclohydrolase PurH